MARSKFQKKFNGRRLARRGRARVGKRAVRTRTSRAFQTKVKRIVNRMEPQSIVYIDNPPTVPGYGDGWNTAFPQGWFPLSGLPALANTVGTLQLEGFKGLEFMLNRLRIAFTFSWDYAVMPSNAKVKIIILGTKASTVMAGVASGQVFHNNAGKSWISPEVDSHPFTFLYRRTIQITPKFMNNITTVAAPAANDSQMPVIIDLRFPKGRKIVVKDTFTGGLLTDSDLIKGNLRMYMLVNQPAMVSNLNITDTCTNVYFRDQ